MRLIDELFQSVPQTRETLEMKEEIVQNLMEKYNDLRAEGRSEDDAFTIAAASVGDINDIIGEAAELEHIEHSPVDAPEYGQTPPSVMSWLQVIVIFLALVIASPFAVSLFRDWRGRFLGVTMLLCALGLLIHQVVISAKNRRHSNFEHARFVDEAPDDHEWAPVEENRKIYRSLNSALWTVAIAAYFLISYLGNTWYLSWIMFLITPAVSKIMKAAFGLTTFRRAFTAAFWLMVNVLYFVVSFATGAWAVTWIIYLIAASIHNVIKASCELKKGR